MLSKEMKSCSMHPPTSFKPKSKPNLLQLACPVEGTSARYFFPRSFWKDPGQGTLDHTDHLDSTDLVHSLAEDMLEEKRQ